MNGLQEQGWPCKRSRIVSANNGKTLGYSTKLDLWDGAQRRSSAEMLSHWLRSYVQSSSAVLFWVGGMVEDGSSQSRLSSSYVLQQFPRSLFSSFKHGRHRYSHHAPEPVCRHGGPVYKAIFSRGITCQVWSKQSGKMRLIDRTIWSYVITLSRVAWHVTSWHLHRSNTWVLDRSSRCQDCGLNSHGVLLMRIWMRNAWLRSM